MVHFHVLVSRDTLVGGDNRHSDCRIVREANRAAMGSNGDDEVFLLDELWCCFSDDVLLLGDLCVHRAGVVPVRYSRARPGRVPSCCMCGCEADIARSSVDQDTVRYTMIVICFSIVLYYLASSKSPEIHLQIIFSGKLTNRSLPLLILIAAIILWAVGALEGTYPCMWGSGTILSWIYLRFWQRHSSGTRGDMADNFSFDK